ncbi:helix-turn-helix domain-containing protein [Ekhidna sp.]|uniref:helix-turn-helix domain-containing protein n=1 Tax=Ekhidna sp. TaxID=2608089 RepID=UPI003299FD08
MNELQNPFLQLHQELGKISLLLDHLKESVETRETANLYKEVMTVDEVAEYLGVKPQTIYNYKNEGKIPYTKKIGLRFIKKEIDAWLIDQNWDNE